MRRLASVWVLAITRPRGEFAVARRLNQLCIDHFLFKHRVASIRRGQRTEHLVPAFPRYVFLCMIDAWWQRLLEEVGDLVGYVRHLDHTPVAVPPSVLTQLVDQSSRGAVLPLQDDTAPKFRLGDKIQIAAGGSVASGCRGVYQYPTRPGRVCVLMPWLGQMVSVEVDENEIEAFEPRRRRNRRGRRGGYRHNRQRDQRAAQVQTAAMSA